jgi:hypothetical protein
MSTTGSSVHEICGATDALGTVIGLIVAIDKRRCEDYILKR